MKFCQVALLLSLGITADLSLAAQALPPDTVMVASEAMPHGGLFLPEMLAANESAGHAILYASLSGGLPAHPAISQALPVAPVPVVPEGPLTKKDRLTLFWNDTYAPGAFAGVSMGALVDQARHTPAKWDGDGSSYTRRFASEYGQMATRNVIHDGLAAMTGLDPRYKPCACSGMLQRTEHAVKAGFVTERQDGRLTLDMPQIAAAYGSGMVSTFWYPHHQFNPLVQGVQFGHMQMGEVVLNNMVQEFGPGIKRALHLHALTERRIAQPGDDD
jgi:hypothetical protein